MYGEKLLAIVSSSEVCCSAGEDRKQALTRFRELAAGVTAAARFPHASLPARLIGVFGRERGRRV
jgi:hypothetical protein